MSTEERIALDCPGCRAEIYRPLAWFKQASFTCPSCGGALSAGRFAAVIEALEQAFEASVAEMVQARPSCGGCGCGKAG